MPDRKFTNMTSGERMLVELNIAVTNLTNQFEKFQTTVTEEMRRVQDGTIGRKEFDLLKIEAEKIHVNHETRITQSEKDVEALEQSNSTISGQIRLALWLFGAATIILGIIAPILTAKYIH